MIVAVICVVTIATAGPAAAHTGFESSVPADGDVVGEPVRGITVTFSGPAEPAGEGFAIIDPAGDLRSPDSLGRHDDRTWRPDFDALPLSGGVAGVRWRVQEPDAHPIEGAFSFNVETAATVGPVPGADQSTEPGNIVHLDAFLNGEGSSSEVGGRIAAVGRVAGTGGTLFVAAGIGAHNHRVLVPVMEQERPTGSAPLLFRKAVVIESAAMGAAVVITALLVGAGS